MRNFAAPRSSVLGLDIGYYRAYHESGYTLSIAQSHDNDTAVGLFVHENPLGVIGRIIKTDAQENTHVQEYPLLPDEQQSIVQACSQMIKCVESGVLGMNERQQQKLDAIIQPYLDRLHQKVAA